MNSAHAIARAESGEAIDSKPLSRNNLQSDGEKSTQRFFDA